MPYNQIDTRRFCCTKNSRQYRCSAQYFLHLLLQLVVEPNLTTFRYVQPLSAILSSPFNAFLPLGKLQIHTVFNISRMHQKAGLSCISTSAEMPLSLRNVFQQNLVSVFVANQAQYFQPEIAQVTKTKLKMLRSRCNRSDSSNTLYQ